MHFALFEVTSVAQLVQTALYPVFVFKTMCVCGGGNTNTVSSTLTTAKIWSWKEFLKASVKNIVET